MAKIRIALAGILSAGALASPAVAQEGKPSAAPLVVVSTAPAELSAGSIVREIDDPGAGVRWLLVQDSAHPGGPGRLIGLDTGAAARRAPMQAGKVARTAPVIHAGDRIEVVEHTAVVDANLQAVALESAVCGGMLRVRLRVGGHVLAALALGRGRAELSPAGERP